MVSGKLEADYRNLSLLTAEEISEYAKSLTPSQKEKILELLSDKEAPPWIKRVKKTHNELSGFMQSIPINLPTRQSRIQEIVKSIMITAGDYIPPCKDAVRLLTTHLSEWGKNLTQRCITVKQLQAAESNAANRFFSLKHSRDPNLEAQFQDSDLEESFEPDTYEIDRLRFNDLRTQSMTSKEYQTFVRSRRMNFYTNGKKSFMKLVGVSSTSNLQYIELLSYLAWSHLQLIVESALRKRSASNELEIQNEPLRVDELEAVIAELS